MANINLVTHKTQEHKRSCSPANLVTVHTSRPCLRSRTRRCDPAAATGRVVSGCHRAACSSGRGSWDPASAADTARPAASVNTADTHSKTHTHTHAGGRRVNPTGCLTRRFFMRPVLNVNIEFLLTWSFTLLPHTSWW